jgi:hypothetical protein
MCQPNKEKFKIFSFFSYFFFFFSLTRRKKEKIRPYLNYRREGEPFGRLLNMVFHDAT